MAGHNQWSKVKRLKAATSSLKGKAFSRPSRGVTLAAEAGGGAAAAKVRLQQCFPRPRHHGIKPDSAGIAYLPTTPVPLSAPAVASILERLHDDREELDDMQIVFSDEVIV